MYPIREHEKEVIGLLTSHLLTPGQIDALMEDGNVVSCEYTGSGYLLTIRHALLPRKRTVCFKPVVMGRADGIDCGFVIFIENNELTIECHSWGDDIPNGFRERKVQISTLP